MKKIIIFCLIFLMCFPAYTEIDSTYFEENKLINFQIIGYLRLIEGEVNLYENGQIDLFLTTYPKNIAGIFLYEPPRYTAFGVWEYTKYGLHIKFWQEDFRNFNKLNNLALVIVTYK